jgi:hypothetical protein
MKINVILVLALLSCIGARAQRDFDYTLYTRKAHMKGIGAKDTVPAELLLERQIIKANNSLKIVSLGNTGDAIDYHLQYYGISPSKEGYDEFVYRATGPDSTLWIIRVAPTVPRVRILALLDGILLAEYF